MREGGETRFWVLILLRVEYSGSLTGVTGFKVSC